jgi:putative transposase
MMHYERDLKTGFRYTPRSSRPKISPDQPAARRSERPSACRGAGGLKSESRDLSKASRGRRSRRATKTRKALARRHRRVANRRKDRNHQITARLVRAHKLIATEEQALSNMTASAKGTAQKPGGNGKAKAGLNRAILDATPGSS